MLLALGQSVHGTMAVLAAGIIESAAATRRLDRLGGLVHRMPAATLALSTALIFPAALPPFAGFAGLWLAFQAALAITRSGDLLIQITLILVTAGMGLSAALGGAVLVRTVGVACLGRPRTPRSAVAADSHPHRTLWGALAAAAALLGLFPGAVLRLASLPAIEAATGVNLAANAGWFLLSPGTDQPGYAPLAVGLIAGGSWSGLFWLLRRQPRPAPRAVSAWQDGFAPPPPWLPFGDPLTQAGTSGFAPDPSAIPSWHSLIPARLRPLSPAVAVGLLIALVAGGGFALRWASLP
jgi:NADH:ubiquinone oxidoreductase subunit 5 (subunit L)/multisubunit Na+/H+ antiporter MnhA subunit